MIRSLQAGSRSKSGFSSAVAVSPARHSCPPQTQLLSLEGQSFFALFCCVPFLPVLPVAGLDKRRPWRGSHCSAAGGSSSGPLPGGSGGSSSCTSSVLTATLSGCSQRFSCSSVLRGAKTPRETRTQQQRRTGTHGNSVSKTLCVYSLHLRGS